MKIKRVVAVLLFVCLLVNCIPPVQTNAATAFFAYEIADGTAIITGCDNVSGDVELPDMIQGYPVAKIGEGAFRDCTELTSVVIPEGVTVIDKNAFYNCTGLTSVTIPASVTSILHEAFHYCNNLEAVYISNLAAWCNIRFGDSFANPLYYANNLHLDGKPITELVIPDGVTQIKFCAFICCDSLTSVAFPASVTSVGQAAFLDCNSLNNVIYCGTQEQWDAISIGDNNETLTNAALQYHDYVGGVCTSCGHVLAEAMDLNGDGKISAFDAQILAEAKAGLRELTDAQWQAVDGLSVNDIIDYILGRFPGMETVE